MTSTDVHAQQVKPLPRKALEVAAAVVISIVVNAGIALVTRSLDPNGTRTGLALIAYGPMTALGVLAGVAGWAAVRRVADAPRAALRVLVPAVVVLSLVPGIVLIVVGKSLVNVAGLWVMHLAVAAITVITARRVLPLADKNI